MLNLASIVWSYVPFYEKISLFSILIVSNLPNVYFMCRESSDPFFSSSPKHYLIYLDFKGLTAF